MFLLKKKNHAPLNLLIQRFTCKRAGKSVGGGRTTFADGELPRHVFLSSLYTLAKYFASAAGTKGRVAARCWSILRAERRRHEKGERGKREGERERERVREGRKQTEGDCASCTDRSNRVRYCARASGLRITNKRDYATPYASLHRSDRVPALDTDPSIRDRTADISVTDAIPFDRHLALFMPRTFPSWQVCGVEILAPTLSMLFQSPRSFVNTSKRVFLRPLIFSARRVGDRSILPSF